MSNTGIFFVNLAVAAVAFIGAAPCILLAVSAFTIQRRITREMVERKVVSPEYVKRLATSKNVSAVVIAVLVTAAVAVTAFAARPFGFMSMGAGLLLGLLKYRRICQYNSLNFNRFAKTYDVFLDRGKFESYAKETFCK